MKKMATDRILGISAILISLLTLIMFIYQTNIMHKQSRLSVTPRLGLSTTFNQQDSIVVYSTVIRNKGIGPAIIEASGIIHKGKEYPLDFEQFFETVYPELEKYGSFNKFSNLGVGSTIAVDESKTLFSFRFIDDQTEAIQTYLQVGEEDPLPFNIEVAFSSMYDEKWKIDILKGGHPVKVE